MLEKVEVDLNLLLNKSWFVALCSDSEMLLLKTIKRELLMCEVVKVLERELENSGLIYVYQEGGEGNGMFTSGLHISSAG